MSNTKKYSQKGIAAMLRSLEIEEEFYSYLPQTHIQAFITKMKKECPSACFTIKRFILVDPKLEEESVVINRVKRTA